MTHAEIVKKIASCKIVPVIKITDVEQALPLADALLKGNLPLAEITLRSPQGIPAIRKVVKENPEVLVGAGTILSIDDAKNAMDAGASFLVTPGFNPKVVEYCVKNNWLIVPGVNSPSGVEQGLELGLQTLKFFPAEQSGGIAMLKALSGPYGNVRFMPTGGVGMKNIKDYLSQKNVIAVGGSWMVGTELLEKRQFDEISKLCLEATASLA